MKGESLRTLWAEWAAVHGESGVRIGCCLMDPSGRVWWEQDSEKHFIPASNQKLWTAGTALDRLGPEFRWQTRFSWEEGICWIRGGGDPGFDEAQSAVVAVEMKRAGLKRLSEFRLDCSVNPDPVWAPGWMWDDLGEGFAAPVSAFVSEGNRIRFSAHPGPKGPVWTWKPEGAQIGLDADVCWDSTRPTDVKVRRKRDTNHFFLQGTLSKDEPHVEGAVASGPHFFVEGLTRMCRKAGIQVDRDPRIRFEPYRQVTNEWIQSSYPLTAFLSRVNGDSDNLTAEILLRTVGRDHNGVFSHARGLETLSNHWRELGVEPPARQTDGSGLSPYNAVTPRALASWMRRRLDLPHRKEWMDSLARWGISGTLERRPPLSAPMAVAAKTGSLTGVRSLTGYLLRDGGAVVAIFSLLINGLLEDEHGERLQDQFVEWLCREHAGV
ncbi:D-alanyl-D-alanine carboxypeptidase/D-alanyl-D-alanine-endopeptidase (penicillin-binding protein 4) [Desmospora profundinema]|uniref:D-alanyl-D-alanine carboxypeptidase/D-alanyl-D-alanine-endopeptidase (Penicillin-binding protein 4) n=1 Tax=Desmospora profundinema TaxID=1571184 RepID=A0ABU1ILG0_9BACL|nr:D-alanyl-D-alanine carboxypeptidase/D-alanyl-D-alanine-endopeptidase (penicillin-binding protein 4) [Desmospora profundinema]